LSGERGAFGRPVSFWDRGRRRVRRGAPREPRPGRSALSAWSPGAPRRRLPARFELSSPKRTDGRCSRKERLLGRHGAPLIGEGARAGAVTHRLARRARPSTRWRGEQAVGVRDPRAIVRTPRTSRFPPSSPGRGAHRSACSDSRPRAENGPMRGLRYCQRRGRDEPAVPGDPGQRFSRPRYGQTCSCLQAVTQRPSHHLRAVHDVASQKKAPPAPRYRIRNWSRVVEPGGRRGPTLGPLGRLAEEFACLTRG
jgi:hypothetical protein